VTGGPTRTLHKVKKMLASTVQFSTYDQPPTTTPPPDPTRTRAVRQTGRPRQRQRIIRSLRTQQRARHPRHS
jgi:hypothetical protein